MRSRILASLSFAVGLSLSVGGCAEESNEGPTCLYRKWEACERPSADARSKPWPEQREQLAQLAIATERAIAAPEKWNSSIGSVQPPHDVPFTDWAGPVWMKDKEQRIVPRIEVDSQFSNLFNALSNVYLSRSSFNVDAAVAAASEADDGFGRLRAEAMFRDPFGQPEPRTVLFSYARAATVMQFLARPADRRTIEIEASAFLQNRLNEWEEMQRGRLAGKSADEVQEAIDSLGTPELRRLMTAWRGIADLDVPPITD